MLNRIHPLRAAAMAATLALAAAIAAPFASAQGAGYWHTSGNKILDSNGTEVRIAGINWYGFETPDFIIHGLWAQDYRTILSDIKSLGFNVIRVPFSNQMVESNPVPTNFTTTNSAGQAVNGPLVGQTALQDLDSIVSYAGSIGLRIILDNHRSEAGSSNESSGLWYTSAYPQANWIADWQTLATRYSASQFTFNGNPTVIGVDLRNEPHLSGTTSTSGSCWTGDTATNGCPVTLTTQNWPVAATAAGNAVLAINPHLLVFVEGNDCYSGVCGWQGGNLIGVANFPVTLSVPNQLAYSAHDYGPNLFQQAWFNSSTTLSSLESIWNLYWAYISADGIAPVWVGEFGTDNTSTDIENTAAGSQGQWFESLITFLQNNPQLNWTNWALNGEDTYALLDSNYDPTPVSALKESLLESIQFPLGGGTTPTPGFSLAPSAAALTVTQGASATDTITVTDTGGFTGAVTLTTSTLPTGVTAAFATNPTTGSSVATFTASSTATAGTSNVTITGTSGTTTASTTISLTVKASTPAGFSLAASAASVTVVQGGASATDTITVTDTGGFTGSVTLTTSTLPTGVTATFATNPTTGTSVVTFAASSTATTGATTVTITGTSGSTTATTTINLTVNPSTTPAGFSLAASSASVTVAQGATATDTITVTDTGGFTGAVTLTTSALPSGVTATFATNPTTGSSVVTFAATSAATAGGPTAVTITGTSGTTTATTSISLTVTATTPPSFTLAASPTSLSVTQGATATDTITVTGTGGFAGSVTLAATGLPSGVTAAFGTNPTTGSSIVTFTATSAATTGLATVTITGTSGTLTASTAIALTVVASPPPGGFACHVVYTINSQWPGSPGGFGVGLTIENTGTTNWTSWTLTWTFANGQTVTQLWNGSETQSGANVTVNNLSYDGSIPAGGSNNSVGFNGTWNGTTNSAPTAFSINGNACH